MLRYNPFNPSMDKQTATLLLKDFDKLEAVISPSELLEIAKQAALMQGTDDTEAPEYLPKTVEKMESFRVEHWVFVAMVNYGLRLIEKDA